MGTDPAVPGGSGSFAPDGRSRKGWELPIDGAYSWIIVKLRLHSLGTALTYAYVLRIPLAIWIALIAFPFLAVPKGAPVGALLRGLFDLSDPGEHRKSIEHLVEGSAFAFVMLAALMGAATVAVTVRLILKDGADRFNIPRVTVSPGIELALRLLAALVPVVITGGAASQSASTVSPLVALGGSAIGIAVFVRILIPLQRALWDGVFKHPRARRPLTVAMRPVRLLLRLFEWFVGHTRAGFTNARGRLLRRHAFAFFQMLVSVALYTALFVLKLEPFSNYLRIPTLCLVLILAMVVCWGLTALSFTLDRFRIPVIAILVMYGTVVAVFPQGDHFFPSVTTTGAPRTIDPAQVLSRRAEHPAIAVAAMGGGIHAGAWVARVLAGLQNDSVVCGTDFDRALSVISSVSGGSMGAMFIVDAYRNGALRDPKLLEEAVKAAEASSLDDVAWALVYPDLAWAVAPFLKGVWVDWHPLRVHLISGRNLVLDRGTVLENSWKRTPTLASATLDDWRADLAAGRRPAVIFNATVVETGERMLLGTSTIDGRYASGRVDFGTDPAYASDDVQVVTAARLSSTFPYVSPPARIQRNTVFDNQFHMVDGGYYDNYGTATLIDWLAKSLEQKTARPSRVMLLQIRTFPVGGRPSPDGRRGWLFETMHPLLTLFTVRGAAQLSTSNVGADLVTRAGHDYVVPITIDFPDRAYQDLDDVAPPLSWHLTGGDRKRLRAAWHDPDLKLARARVQNFLQRRYDDISIPACIH